MSSAKLATAILASLFFSASSLILIADPFLSSEFQFEFLSDLPETSDLSETLLSDETSLPERTQKVHFADIVQVARIVVDELGGRRVELVNSEYVSDL